MKGGDLYMDKYDTLLGLGGAEVVDVKEWLDSEETKIDELPPSQEFFVALLEYAMESFDITKHSLQDYEYKFVIRKKEP